MRALSALVVLFSLAAPAQAAPIQWGTDADGGWEVAGNWDPAQVPGGADDVTIDRGSADPTVTHSSGADTVLSLTNEEAIVVDGGSITTGIYAGGSDSSVSATGAGVFLRATGATTLDGSDLFANDGALIDLAVATSYATTGPRRTFRADGGGLATTIDLSGVTSLTGATSFNAEMLIEAIDAGVVDLGGVTALSDSSIDVLARGAGSVVDLSGLTSFVDTGSSLDVSRIEAANGGAVLLNGSQPVVFDGYTIVLDGATSTLDTSQVTTLTNSTVQAIGAGVQPDLGAVTSFDESSYFAESGASIAIGASSYAAGSRTRTLEADGTGSSLDGSALTSLSGATGVNANLRVQALAGGSVDFRNVTSVADSSFVFRADGAGSVIDLSGLTTFVDTGSGLDISQIEATRGGSVLLDTTGPLSFDGYYLLRDGATSTLDTSALASLVDSTVEVRGLGTTLDISGASSLDDDSFLARDGASLTLHGPSYTATGTRTIEASGSEAGTPGRIDGSSFTQLSGPTAPNRQLRVNALSGGRVELENVATLADSSFAFRAVGTDSVIDLSSLSRFVDTGPSIDVSLLEIADGGEILVDSSGPLEVQGYTLRVDGATSLLDTTQLTTLSDSSVEAIGLGTTVDLAAVASLDENSFLAADGASLELLGSSYASGAAGRTLRARGEESGTAALLDASSWTSLTGATGLNAVLRVEATTGGFVDLGNLSTLTDSSVAFVANGVGSTVDLRSLDTYLDTGSSLDRSSLEARNGGTLLLPAQPTQVEGYRLIVEGASDLDATNVTSLVRSEARAIGPDAVLDLSSIASADTNSFWADVGATLVVPDTGYEAGPGNTYFRAYGRAGAVPSRLDASGITTLVGATTFGADHEIGVIGGGEVDLSSLVSITGGGVRVSATNADSRVDLSSLASFVDTSNASSIQARDGGLVQLGAATTSVLSNVSVIASPTGTIEGSRVEALAGSRVSGSGRLDFDLLLDDSVISPGGTQPADVLELAGDFDQTGSAVIEIDIAGLLSVEFDRIDVLGTAVLAGAVDVDLISLVPGQPAFDPQLGDSFDVLTAVGIVDAGVFVSSPLPGSLFWRPDVFDVAGGQALRLTVALPEPSTGWLLGLGLALGLGGRRRRPAGPPDATSERP